MLVDSAAERCREMCRTWEEMSSRLRFEKEEGYEAGNDQGDGGARGGMSSDGRRKPRLELGLKKKKRLFLPDGLLVACGTCLVRIVA